MLRGIAANAKPLPAAQTWDVLLRLVRAALFHIHIHTLRQLLRLMWNFWHLRLLLRLHSASGRQNWAPRVERRAALFLWVGKA